MRKFLIPILAALALLAVIGNFGLYRLAKRVYTREAMVRLKPLGTPSYVETGPEGSPRVLLLGDSRIGQWKHFAAEQYCVINAGVGGETSAQIWLRTGEAIERTKPSVIIIQAGINDLKAIPLVPNSQKQIEADCVQHLMEMVKQSRKYGAAHCCPK